MECCVPLLQFSFNADQTPAPLNGLWTAQGAGFQFYSIMLKVFTFKVKGEMIIALAGDIHITDRGFQDDPVPGDDAAQ
jgi:hypothetical protein